MVSEDSTQPGDTTADNSVPANAAPILKIGHVATIVGVSTSRIRFWEKQRLISPQRTESGQRQFSLQDVKRLEKIRRLLDSKSMTVVGLRKQLQEADNVPLDNHSTKPYGLAMGQRVNAIRKRRQMSLRTLSQEIGMSASALSAFERGISKPSVGKLTQIAHALNTTTPELLGVSSSQDQLVVRRTDRDALPLENTGVIIENLYKSATVLQSQMVTLEPGCSSGEPMTHFGEDFLIVIEGEITVTLDTLENFTLTAGDAMTFDSTRPHSYANPGSVTSRAVWVNTPPTF